MDTPGPSRSVEEVISDLRSRFPALKKFDRSVVNLKLSDVRGPRLRSELVAAIAECNTLTAIELEESNLSPHEVATLCAGLRSNPVLRVLKLSRNSIFGQEASCKSLGEVVMSCAATLVVVELEKVNMDARGISHLVNGLMEAPEHSAFQELSLSGNHRLGDEGIEVIAKMVASDAVTGLQKLSICDCGMQAPGAKSLAAALARSRKTLRVLEVGMTRKLARHHHVPFAAANPGQPLSDLLYGLSRSRSRHIASSLRRLTLGLWAPEPGVAQAMCQVLPTMCDLQALSIVQPNFQDSQLIKVLESLKQLRNLHELTLDRHVGLFALALDDHSVTRGLVGLLSGNHPLRILRVGALRLTQTDLRRLFESLLLNVNLESLDLQGCRSADGSVFDSLMHLLQTNITLRCINLADTPLEVEGKVATVEAALAQNAKRYVAVLKVMPSVPPRAGRIFLCGSPFAGKTTLRKSLVASSSWMTTHRSKFVTALRHCLGCEVNQRTRGVEVHLFIDEGDMRISIWDMAGQQEYHALHDFIFPVVNHAYLFVFVFDIASSNSNHHQAHSGRINVAELRERFRNELTYWLFFVASNSKMSPAVLPRMLIVLTHMDKARITPDGAKKWAKDTIADIAQLFADVVEVCEPIFAVDARTANQSITELVSFLKTSFKGLLTEKLNKVPEVCDEMARELAKWRASHPTKPLLRKSSLKESQNKLARLQSFGHTTPRDVRAAVEERRTAVNAYLHDVGEIINFEDLNYIVVNPHWFGKGILGHLIQVGEEQYTSDRNNGFLRKSDLNMLLEISLHTLVMELGDLQTEDLVELMLKLELCYEVDPGSPDSGYFVPATLAGKDKLCWPGNDLSSHGTPPAFTYFGRRLACRDQLRTFLTLGFFPRLQAVLHNAYKREVQDQKLEYRLQQNLISVRYNGMDMFIEYEDEKRRHVDVLVRYNGQYTNTEIGFVQELMNKIKSFTASEKGNQGVALVEGIIRPACVRRLTPSAQRAGQSVLIETLMENLHAAPNYPQYQHTWSQLDEVLDEPGDNYALTLLGPSGPEMVFKKQRAYLQEVQAQLSHIIQHGTSKQMSTEVQVRVDSKELGHREGAGSKTTEKPQHRVQEYSIPLPKSAGSECCTSPVGSQEHRIHGFMVDMKTEVLSAVACLSQTVLGVEARLTDTLTQIKVAIKCESDHIRREQTHLRNELSKQLDQVIEFSVEQEQRQLPRLLYLTKEVRNSRRLVARLVPGSQAVRLHLMCEHPDRPHGVVDQPGYPMQLDDETARILRPLLVGTLKVLLMLAKVGAHIAAGIGNAIPDYADVGAALPITVTGLTVETLTDDCEVERHKRYGKANVKVLDVRQNPRKEDVVDSSSPAGFWLRKLVREKVLPNMQHLFLLEKCAYKDKAAMRVRWLCAQCRKELCNSQP